MGQLGLAGASVDRALGGVQAREDRLLVKVDALVVQRAPARSALEST